MGVCCRPSIKGDMRLLRMKSLVFLICALLTLGVDEATSSLADWATEAVDETTTSNPIENTTEIGQGPTFGIQAPCPRACYWNSRFESCRYRPGFGRGRCRV